MMKAFLYIKTSLKMEICVAQYHLWNYVLDILLMKSSKILNLTLKFSPELNFGLVALMQL